MGFKVKEEWCKSLKLRAEFSPEVSYRDWVVHSIEIDARYGIDSLSRVNVSVKGRVLRKGKLDLRKPISPIFLDVAGDFVAAAIANESGHHDVADFLIADAHLQAKSMAKMYGVEIESTVEAIQRAVLKAFGFLQENSEIAPSPATDRAS